MGRKRRSRNQDTGRTIDQEGERPRTRTTRRKRRSTQETRNTIDEPTQQQTQQIEPTQQESYGEPISPMSQPAQQQQTEPTKQEIQITPISSTVEFNQQLSQLIVYSASNTENQYSKKMYIYPHVSMAMVGKRRGYNPNSPNKVALNVYNIASARAGIYATESPILQMMIYEYAKNAAQKWDAYGSWAASLYNRITAQHKLTPYQKAAVRALVGQASKYLEDINKGIQIDKTKLAEELRQTASNLGVTIPDEVITAITIAVTGTA